MKTIQTMMKAITTLLLSMLALSVYAAVDEQEIDVSALDAVNWSADGLTPMTVTHEGKTFQCQPFRMKKASEEEHEFAWLEVTTTHGGELAELLGDKNTEIDSLVVNGSINAADIKTLFRSSLYGYLEAINLEGAVIENNEIPDNAFFDPEEQYVDDEKNDTKFYYIVLRNIILPEGLKRIGKKAFYQALVLENVHFPSSLKELGGWAFSTTRLKMDPLALPEGVEKIGCEAFSFCRKLAGQVVLPSTIKEIERWAFYGSPITAINLPEGLEKMGDCAFWQCNLKEVSLPSTCRDFGLGFQFGFNTKLEKMHLADGMTEIPDYFAVDCFKLRDVNIPHTVTHIGARAFQLCLSLKSLELPLGVQSLGEGALSALDSLEQIVFPASMKTLGVNSCEMWNSIQKIYCAAIEPPVCVMNNENESPFNGYGKNLTEPTVYVPVGTADKYRNAEGWRDFHNFVEIEQSEFPVTAIYSAAITEIDGEESYDNVYDLQGRKVNTPQKGHIYVSKGRKFTF